MASKDKTTTTTPADAWGFNDNDNGSAIGEDVQDAEDTSLGTDPG